MSLRLEAVTVAYGGVPALAGIDLTVTDREIVSVLGPSGSGKSTMLRAIAGLVPEARGVISWDGTDLAGVPTHRRDFGLMFQDHALFPHRDVLGNVAFGLRMRGMPRADVHERATSALARVGLAGFEHRRVSELSGGEQQRVALARALAPEPRLLMLDEPLGALDRALRDRLVGELRALFTDLGISVLFVTHDHDEAFALADRVVVMHDGQIAQDGAPAEVWRHPADAFVARFLGWNVTSAFSGHLAVDPSGLVLADHDAAGSGVEGTVVGRTFRRDHHLIDVRLASGDDVRVAVELGTVVPEIGTTTVVALRRDARVLALDSTGDERT
jgi:thiamine transport system ATP-binding protein